MKNFKRISALLLTVAMMLVMTVSTFAATIEVEGAYEGETYDAYKILNFTSDTTVDPAAYSYFLTAEEYEGGLGELLEGAGFEFVASADGTQYTVANADELTDAEAIAEYLYENLEDLADVAIASASATGTEDGTAEFEDLETGYWFVTSSLGSLCTLQSYDDEELVVEKNTTVTDEKVADKATAQIGDTINYTITLTDGKGTNLEAKITDTMSAGLTYNNDATVVANYADGAATLVKDTDYTVSVTGGNGSATTIVYTFTAAVMTKLAENETIVVTYTATLNEFASLDGTEVNTEYTEYSEQETDGNEVEVNDYNLTIQKKANSEEGDSLKGAQFELYRNDETTPTKLVDITDTIEEPAANTVYYRVANGEESGAVTVIDMTDAYDAVIYGLDGESTYKVREIVAPEGYNLLEEDVEVEMDNANQIQPIVNNAGSVLPSTGGIGTTMFYILGTIMVLGAGVYMVSKRRMSAE